jgi:hypothetical protein
MGTFHHKRFRRILLVVRQFSRIQWDKKSSVPSGTVIHPTTNRVRLSEIKPA